MVMPITACIKNAMNEQARLYKKGRWSGHILGWMLFVAMGMSSIQAEELLQNTPEGDVLPSAETVAPSLVPGIPSAARTVAPLAKNRVPSHLRLRKTVLRGLGIEIAFGPNIATVPLNARPILDQLATALKTPALSHYHLRMAGHSDASGSSEKNQVLSQRRADAIRIYLITKGVSAKRLTAVGYGSNRMRFPHTPMDPRNRCVALFSVGSIPLPPIQGNASPLPSLSTKPAAETTEESSTKSEHAMGTPTLPLPMDESIPENPVPKVSPVSAPSAPKTEPVVATPPPVSVPIAAKTAPAVPTQPPVAAPIVPKSEPAVPTLPPVAAPIVPKTAPVVPMPSPVSAPSAPKTAPVVPMPPPVSAPSAPKTEPAVPTLPPVAAPSAAQTAPVVPTPPPVSAPIVPKTEPAVPTRPPVSAPIAPKTEPVVPTPPLVSAPSAPKTEPVVPTPQQTAPTPSPNVADAEQPEYAEDDLLDIAESYDDQGRYEEAEVLYKRFLRIRASALGMTHPEVARCFNDLAMVYEEENRYEQAESLYKRALTIRDQVLGANHSDVASSLNNLAEFYRNQSRYEEAEPLYKRALAIREQALGPTHPNIAQSLNNLAALYDDQGRDDEAEPLYRRALTIWAQTLGTQHPNVATALGNLGRLYSDRGEYRKTVESIEQATAIWQQVLPNDQNASNLGGQAISNARHALQRLQHLSANLRYRITATPHPLDVLYTEVGHEPALHSFWLTESFAVGQLQQDASLRAPLAQTAERYAMGNGPLLALQANRSETWAAWQKADADLLKAVNASSNQYLPATMRILRSHARALSRKLEDIDRRIDTEFATYANLTAPHALSISEIQGWLQPDEAMLSYVFGTGEGASYVWCIRKHSASVRRLPFWDAWIKRIDALRTTLTPWQNPGWAPFPVVEAGRLFQDLMGPESVAWEGVKTLIIVPDGPIERVPFAVLVTENTTETANDRKIPWLARRWATVTLPAVASLRTLRANPRSPNGRMPILVFGNPDFGSPVPPTVLSEPSPVLLGTTHPTPPPAAPLANVKTIVIPSTATVALTNHPIADADQLRTLWNPLPNTADTLRAMAYGLGAAFNDLNLADHDSMFQVRATHWENYRTVVFANPVLVAGRFEGIAEPAIVLTPPRHAVSGDDGLLRASQIARLTLDADWIVLPMCSTAETTEVSGLRGLAKAFFHAGARAVLVSHWPALSESSTKLLTNTLHAWQAAPQLGRAEALRRSMMDLLDSESQDPHHTHPMAWAPFVLESGF